MEYEFVPTKSLLIFQGFWPNGKIVHQPSDFPDIAGGFPWLNHHFAGQKLRGFGCRDETTFFPWPWFVIRFFTVTSLRVCQRPPKMRFFGHCCGRFLPPIWYVGWFTWVMICAIKGTSLKLTIDSYCLIRPNMGNLMIPGLWVSRCSFVRFYHPKGTTIFFSGGSRPQKFEG